MADINRLSYDCLNLIFAYLPLRDKVRFERVSKRWQEISLGCWKLLSELKLTEMVDRNGCLVWQALSKALTCSGHRLTKIDLSGVDTQVKLRKYNIFKSICENCPELQVLRLEYQDISNKDIQLLAANCKKLTHLSLIACNGLMDKHLVTILEHCKELTFLDVSHCSRVTGQFFTALTPALNTLVLKGTGLDKLEKYREHLLHIKSVSFQKTAPKTLYSQAILTMKTTIEHLSLTGTVATCDVIAECINLQSLCISQWKSGESFINFEQITKNCQDLKSLTILDSHYPWTPLMNRDNILHQEELFMHVSNLTKLEVLLLNNIFTISNMFLTHISKSLINLKIFECQNNTRINDEGIGSLLYHCVKLEELNLTGCKNITMITLQRAESTVFQRGNRLPLTMHLGGTQVTEENVAEIVTLPYMEIMLG